MPESDRHRQILDSLTNQPFASVRDLALKLEVSAATVRREIDRLDELGLARKVYGGVSAIDGAAAHNVFARTYSESSDIAVAAKRAIAEHAATMVEDGDSIIINGGSTCFKLGELLCRRNIRLCTNSMPLAALVGEQGICSLTISGGELHREPRIIHGPSPVAPFYASKLFLSAQGVGEAGLLESHPLLIEASARFAEHADRIIALVDSAKFAVGARKLSLPWSRIDTLITDDGISVAHQAMVEDLGVNLQIANFRDAAK